MDRYLTRLERELARRGFRGAAAADAFGRRAGVAGAARDFPIRLLESGPAGGGLATALFGAAAGHSRT